MFLRKILFITILILFSMVVFFNLGKFIDVTQAPIKADIIVSLGGDENGCRIKKALALHKEGYSLSGTFIYTGKEAIGLSFSPIRSRRDYLEKHGVPEQKIIHVDTTVITNTMEEVFFIKKYMQKHHYKTVIFVTHPHHSRRISSLAKYIAHYQEADLHFTIVNCQPPWWDREHYYKNKIAIVATLQETVKLVYNLFKYNPLLISHTQYVHKLKSNKWEEAIKKLDTIPDLEDNK